MRISVALVSLVALCALGCTEVDPEDERKLEQLVDGQPQPTRDRFFAAAGTWTTRQWLNGRPPNDEVIKALCRSYSAKDGWSDWEEVGQELARVEHMIACMAAGFSYIECGEKMIRRNVPDLVKVLEESAAGFKWECKGEWTPFYKPDMVPGGDRDLSRQPVTTEEVVKWLVALPAPPPGFVFVELAPLLPLLCPLGVDWGCPGNPKYPGGGDR